MDHARLPALASLLALLLAAGCGREAPTRPRNVLLVSVDTLRADRLGLMGRAEAGTPAMDGLARRGTAFTDAMTPAPITLVAHASLLTGQDPTRHRVRNNGMFALGAGVVTLAEALEARGFRTGGFVGSVVLARRYGLAQGFDVYTEPGIAMPGQGRAFLVGERPAAAVNEDVVRFVRADPAVPFFAFVHYMEPHFPYEPPEPEATRHARDPYQGEVATVDRALGGLVAALDGAGLLDDTLIVLTADHGEDLGDHGEQTHGVFLYQPTLHVPLVLAGPSVAAGVRVAAPVSLVDVAPTILEALGVPALAGIDGRSLWRVATGAGSPDDVERPLYAETFLPRLDYGWSELRAVRSGASKLIAAPRPELYRLDRDPGERANVIATEAAEAAALAAELDRVVVAGESGAGSSESVTLTEDERAALGALGYVSGAAAGRVAGSAASLPDPKDAMPQLLRFESPNELLRRGEPERAEGVLRAILAQNPRFVDAHNSLLAALVMQGKVEEARRAVDELERTLAGDPTGALTVAVSHQLLGEILAREGQAEAAVVELRRALVVPLSAATHVLLARLEAQLGRTDAARTVLMDLRARGDASAEAEELLRALGG